MPNYEYLNIIPTSLFGTPLREGLTGEQLVTEIERIQTNLATYNNLQQVNNPVSIYNSHAATTSAIEVDPSKQTLEDVIVSDQNALIQQKDGINMMAIVTGITLIIFSVMVLGNNK
jgi:hypothetical protein